MTVCSISGCLIKVYARGWCTKHYSRWLERGDAAYVTPHEERLAFIEHALSLETDECILWPFTASHPRGYGKFKEGGKHFSVHRVICTRAHGDPPTAEHQAAHYCGKTACCNKRHISWKTSAANAADKVMHGTNPRGERNPRAKLNECDVRNIRLEHTKGGVTNLSLAAFFDVSLSTINRIIARETWSHVA